MKKYLVITGILLAGIYLQAAENLTFHTVLSKPVGSFWNLETNLCSYPYISRGTQAPGNFFQSNQTVVNFGPTGQGGTISLKGGPMKVDTLLLEDSTRLEAKTLLFAQPDPADPNDPGGKLSIFKGASLNTQSILINNLIIPKGYEITINVSGITEFDWDVLTVKNATLRDVGDYFKFRDSSPNPPEGTSATFSPLLGADGQMANFRFLASPLFSI